MVGARHFRELDCWQLAATLKRGLYEISRRPVVRRDLRFHDQLRNAAASAPRNISEGFGRKTHKDFAHYLDIARASLTECQNHLDDAIDRGYITGEECRAMKLLCRRALGPTAALQRFLRNNPDP
jgi:four helix bundle protein